ncbi:MAG: Eco57I restriction-modification methylase domain-containing protein [Deltaproteobacteria bacterium]|jgi:adenine-specific DNA-methyltransferase|nr:Eco57I restriction-modification methylase domain-containing protein [Deltaproteobacteria bacterium]
MAFESLNTFDHVRLTFSTATSREERSQIGQFLTSASIANFMSSLFKPHTKEVRILDPGAGAGVLFASLVNNLLSQKKRPLSIEVVAYETDKLILPYLWETIDRCAALCNFHNVRFNGIVKNDDFIASAISETEESLFVVPGKRFTHAILNPPYKKINGDTKTKIILYSAKLEVANLYAAFAWLSMRLLEPGGQIVAITPRSFCNGPYFKKFRVAFLDMLSLRRIHVFTSRNKAFGDDNVLQENIIYSAILETKKPKQVVISASDSDDFDNASTLRIPYEQIVYPGDLDVFIHLGIDDTAISVMKQMQYFKFTLDKLNLSVSTGRTVDFRAKEYLRQTPEKGAVPLIYPCHFQDGFISWPLESGKKPNAIAALPDTSDLFVEKGYYVLVKRFSSKEQKRRVMAAIYDPSRINAPFISFENHLNYFHRNGKGLTEKLTKGLALYLNSSIVDKYFRLFSGHTQVNATDLRKLPYPSERQLIRLGNHVHAGIPDQETIDEIIRKECENCA